MTESRQIDQGKPPRTMSREQRRTQLIEATISTLAARGYSRTTLTEVARTAGLSHGSTQDDCMENVSTSNPPNALKWRRYSAHHIDDHINPWF